jgi:endonuclease III
MSDPILSRHGSGERARVVAPVAPHAQCRLGSRVQSASRALRDVGSGQGRRRRGCRSHDFRGDVAPRIQQVLREITRQRGDLSLDFLAELSVVEARRWLEQLPGVGPKTSAATLLFSRLRMPALPVDSHHHRVAQRLGLIPETLDVGPSHAVLEAQLPPGLSAQQVYDNHEVLMLHGQQCCYFRSPACGRCAVYALCPTGQRLHPELASPGEAEPRSA